MKVHFKITNVLVDRVRNDLSRPHPFAAERVGFISCRVGALPSGGIVVLAQEYHPVADDDYLPDPTVGAMMGPGAIRKAMQVAHGTRSSMFHVHMHEHRGTPHFSRTDLREASKFMPDFLNVQPQMPHGAVVLSLDSAAGICFVPGRPGMEKVSKITLVGAPLVNITG